MLGSITYNAYRRPTSFPAICNSDDPDLNDDDVIPQRVGANIRRASEPWISSRHVSDQVPVYSQPPYYIDSQETDANEHQSCNSSSSSIPTQASTSAPPMA
jgi:hypothetical protein